MNLRPFLLFALALWLAATASAASPDSTDSLLQRHLRAMRPMAEVFAANPVRIESIKGDLQDGERITLHWQVGKFREEYRWLGFTEVFGFDGSDHLYASDLSLPYSLNKAARRGQVQEPNSGIDITKKLIRTFAYVQPAQQQYITLPGEVPLDLSGRYLVLRYAPPGMSEALLLLDQFDMHLAGSLMGNARRLDESVIYRLTTYEDWTDFAACHYPAVIRVATMSKDGESLREFFTTTQQVSVVPPLDAQSFNRSSSPPVPAPVLPEVPYTMNFSFINGTVILRCTRPDGGRRRLELDTGANVGLLRRDVVRRLGLTPVGDERVTGHGGSAQVGYVRVEGIKLNGEVELPPWPAAVLKDDTSLDDALADSGISGLLGNFILNSFVVKLDYRRRRITLYPPDQFDPERDLDDGYHAIPVNRDSIPYVWVTVDDSISGGAFFNTGAPQVFTLSNWALEAAGLEYEVSSVGTGITVHGPTVFGIIHPQVVRLGDLEILDPLTHLEMLAPGEAPNANRIASFGNGFFRRKTITFDLFERMYYIEGRDL
ncbi:retropepsin-like domain-containing protein [bacterium]|nr:retropepsin-like domain-containing protein [bacterium]